MRELEGLWSIFYASREKLRSYAARHAITLTLAAILLFLTWCWILFVGVIT